MPSITALQHGPKHDKHGRPVIDSSGAVIVGNPKLSPTISQNWYLKEIPGAEYEARIVGELLTSRPMIGAEATKAAVPSSNRTSGSHSFCYSIFRGNYPPLFCRLVTMCPHSIISRR